MKLSRCYPHGCRLPRFTLLGLICLTIWIVAVFIFRQAWISCLPSVNPYSYTKTLVSDTASRTPTTPVYVIEEHHEALLYWYHAAEKGLIKQKGNVLLHIDGHSDGAPPEHRDILPKFRLPTTREIYNMMQKNDVFVIAAAFTGLIKRYIWVWSPWDTKSELPDHFAAKVKLGTVTRRDVDGKLIEDICGCPVQGPGEMEESQEQPCLMPKDSNPESPFMEMDGGRCNIHLEDAVIEIVSERKAIELMKAGNWITSLDSVILDIDEDYYGCEAAVQPLYDVGIKQKELDWIGYFVSKLFCPSLPRQELEADKFFADIVDRVISVKQFCQRNNINYCKKSSEMKKYILTSFNDSIDVITNRNLKPALCKSNALSLKAMEALIKHFVQYNTQQLQAMKESGICFMISPRTLVFDASVGMRTCDGFNRPNATIIPFHTPTTEEVSFRTSQLRVMLGAAEIQPGVVTVCRSMRDGYTPRKYFHVIEQDVLGVLKDVFQSVDDKAIFYDPYLLGGTFGWPNRH
ncbi:uncharacterized protein LOC124141132 [Haliotis rufescens]|uniref:uncharacterized protein LOC124141132 n=1 Tax=Haliotis rufescens TaxID=6454 RepID=UPI00201F2462|nr:uncharacterized protein LOC124141132 [Haliotis rufescens]